VNYPHPIWAIDFQFDQTMDGRTLKFLNIKLCTTVTAARLNAVERGLTKHQFSWELVQFQEFKSGLIKFFKLNAGFWSIFGLY